MARVRPPNAGDSDADGAAPPLVHTQNAASGHLYSRSGMDTLGLLARVAQRPAPQLDVGPVDMGCAVSIAGVSSSGSSDRGVHIAFSDINDAFATLSGCARGDAIACAPNDVLTPPVSDGAVARVDARAMYHRAGQGEEQRACANVQKKDGSICRVKTTLIPLRSAHDGRVEWIVGFHAHVSDERAEDAVGLAAHGPDTKTAEELLLADDTDAFHFVFSRDILQYVSPSIQSILGYAPAEVLGKPIQMICHQNDAVALIRELKEQKMARSAARRNSVKIASEDSFVAALCGAQTKMHVCPRSVAETKSVRLDDHVSQQTVIAEVSGLLRMRRKALPVVWMETCARIVLQPSRARRKPRTVIAVSGRPRQNQLGDAGAVPPLPAQMPDSVAAPHAGDAYSGTQSGAPGDAFVWVALSFTGVILKCLTPSDGTVEPHNTESDAEIPVRVRLVLPTMLTQGAVRAVQQVLGAANPRPVSVASWLGHMPVLTTWVPLAPEHLTPAQKRLGVSTIVRVDTQRHGFNHAPEVPFDPDPRWLQQMPPLTADQDALPLPCVNFADGAVSDQRPTHTGARGDEAHYHTAAGVPSLWTPAPMFAPENAPLAMPGMSALPFAGMPGASMQHAWPLFDTLAAASGASMPNSAGDSMLAADKPLVRDDPVGTHGPFERASDMFIPHTGMPVFSPDVPALTAPLHDVSSVFGMEELALPTTSIAPSEKDLTFASALSTAEPTGVVPSMSLRDGTVPPWTLTIDDTNL
ncbi:hypothetical protein MSPP1_002432 [Malassezia sp. CBS 17886]|nr:hypothetical protein MSPP1_002432 [Malassezia sp. CBS 17886]